MLKHCIPGQSRSSRGKAHDSFEGDGFGGVDGADGVDDGGGGEEQEGEGKGEVSGLEEPKRRPLR